MYSYQLDFESGRWVCMGLDAATESAPTMDGVCGFLRRVYVIKRRNRVIVKDSSGISPSSMSYKDEIAKLLSATPPLGDQPTSPL